MRNDLVSYALKYAQVYGWAVFPVSWKTKKPLTPHGCKDAKKDPGAIKNWWNKHPDAAIGVATGSKSNLIVIDEDIDDEKGLNGYEEVTRWEKDHQAFPETVTSITGRGGYHLYYHYEGSDIGNRAGILDGVDVRGEGGYVIAPPSQHPNLTEYHWEFPPDETDIAELNDTIREFLSIGTSYAEKKEFKLPATVGEGQRNDIVFKYACSLQAQGLSDNAIRVAIYDANKERCQPPLDEQELEALLLSAFGYEKGEIQAIKNYSVEYREPNIKMLVDKNGDPTNKPVQSVANVEEAIQYDNELWGRIAYNTLSCNFCVYGNLPWKVHKGFRDWTNTDDTNLWSYIEHKYGLKANDKLMAALNNVATRHEINPVRDMLESASAAWDGNYNHIENLLPKYTGAEKNDYNTAVLKLFMLGAISRIYTPGCKFDYMMVLVGEQGKYKSSFLRFLAGNDEWFCDNFNTLDGDKAFEKLRGMWIIEMAELQATRRTKDVEATKAFITSRDDTYRAPYARRTEHHKRQCVLAGTSNPVDFLTDRTGNRRFLPITCGVVEPVNPFDDIAATRYEFQQAWGEAMDIYNRGDFKLTLTKALEKQALDAQTAYLEEDPAVGIIQAWLDATSENRVCAMMLWDDAMGQSGKIPTRKEINQIHDIMKNSIVGWKYIGKQLINNEYGIQRAYERTETIIDENNLLDKVPFD